MRTPPKKKKPYLIQVKFGEEIVKGEGNTAYEALSSMKRPIKIVGKAFLTITDGKRKKDMMFMPTRAKRLFYPTAQIYIAKQLEIAMR